MQTHVGVNFLFGRAYLYNSDDKLYNEFHIEKVGIKNLNQNDNEKVEKVFQRIKSQVVGDCGCISILFPGTSGNEIRKKVIEYCSKAGFKAFEILDFVSARYIDAVSQSGFKTENGDIIWIFEGNRCFIWKKIQDKAVLIHSTFHDILELKNLEEIKIRSKLDRNPDFILCNLKLDKNLLLQISPNAKIYYYRSKSWETAVLTKARIAAEDPEVIMYNTKAVAFSRVIAKIGEKRVMDFSQDFPLPWTKAIHIKHDANENSLSILRFTDIEENKSLPNLQEFVLIITYDATGMYDIHFHVPSINKDIHENLYLQAKECINTNYSQFFVPQQMTNYSNDVDVVGIDLGASICRVAVNRRNGIETVALDNTGEKYLPSYIAFEERHDKCGKIVINRLRNFAKSTVFDTKLIIGKKFDEIKIDEDWPFKLVQINNNPRQLKDSEFAVEDYFTLIQLEGCDREVLKYPEEVSAILLKNIKEKTEEFQGRKLTEAVITIPMTFTDTQEKATYVAAMLAGWENITFLPEPIAAIFGYSKDINFSNGLNVLIFDLGGSTLNIYVIKIDKDRIIIENAITDITYVGKSFDNILYTYFEQKLSEEYGITELNDKKYKLMFECQKIKESLSIVDEATIDVDEFDPSKEGPITITQKEFNVLAIDLLERIKSTISKVLEKSGNNHSQIDKVLQVGGGCRMPIIKDLLQEIFPNSEHCCDKHHEEIVAVGAAFYAYEKNKDKSFKSIELFCEEKILPSTKPDDLENPIKLHLPKTSIADVKNNEIQVSNIHPLKSNMTIK